MNVSFGEGLAGQPEGGGGAISGQPEGEVQYHNEVWFPVKLSKVETN